MDNPQPVLESALSILDTIEHLVRTHAKIQHLIVEQDKLPNPQGTTNLELQKLYQDNNKVYSLIQALYTELSTTLRSLNVAFIPIDPQLCPIYLNPTTIQQMSTAIQNTLSGLQISPPRPIVNDDYINKTYHIPQTQEESVYLSNINMAVLTVIPNIQTTPQSNPLSFNTVFTATQYSGEVIQPESPEDLDAHASAQDEEPPTNLFTRQISNYIWNGCGGGVNKNLIETIQLATTQSKKQLTYQKQQSSAHQTTLHGKSLSLMSIFEKHMGTKAKRPRATNKKKIRPRL